jgi:hypothetical protein
MFADPKSTKIPIIWPFDSAKTVHGPSAGAFDNQIHAGWVIVIILI